MDTEMDPNSASWISFKKVETRENKTDEKFAKAIDYVCYNLDEPSNLFSDVTCYNAFVYIVKAVHHTDVDFEIFLKTNFEKFITNLHMHFYEKRNDLNLNVNIDPHNAEHLTNLNEKRVTILGYLLYLTMILISRKREFCIQFIDNGLKVYIKCLNDDDFLLRNKHTKVNDLTGNPLGLLDYIILNLAHLSTNTCDEYKQIWSNLDSVSVLLKVANFKESTLFMSYTIISHVASDEQINNLGEIHSIVDVITKLLLRCRNDFRFNMFDRWKKSVHLNGQSFECDVHTIKDDNLVNTSIVSLLQGIYKLAVNEKMKNDLYFRRYITSCLKAFLKKG